jgi:hypothetical protein
LIRFLTQREYEKEEGEKNRKKSDPYRKSSANRRDATTLGTIGLLGRFLFFVHRHFMI